MNTKHKPLGLGVYNGVDLDDFGEIKPILRSFEDRVYTLYVYGSKLKKGDLISINISTSSLHQNIKALVSFSDKPEKFWTNTDSRYILDDNGIATVKLKLQNTAHSVIPTQLHINLNHHEGVLDYMNNYTLIKKGFYYVLDRPIDQYIKAPFTIDTGKLYLQYSGTASLVLLDDGSAIEVEKYYEDDII